MRHRINGRKLNRTSSHRIALFRNLAQALVKHEQITTTLPKAKELRPYVEKLITLGKKNNLASRRLIASRLQSELLSKKIVEILADRYKERAGGYVRIMRSGFRYGDNAPMAVIEFIDRDEAAKGCDELNKLDSSVIVENTAA